ncbi:MAG TPA: hypothetical protein DCZ43_07925 [candidate division Zixibacteria bacterium]|nr:hypothetical protein [candidate division Zixibacteria bacterium]
MDQSRTTIYKYITDAGLPLDFSSYTQIAIDPAYSYLKDITLDYAGNIYFVATHDGYPPYTHYMHYAWSEQYGYRYLDMNDDDVLASTNFELSFGPNNEIIIIESMDYYYQNGSNFFATTDAGNTWLTVLNDQYSNSVIHGTAPRTFSDKIDFIYIAPGSIPWSMTGLFYIPIPRDSIFNNLTAVDGGEALLPEEILLSNYPNPFNPQTTISFSLAKAGRARLAIYDISGRLVATLLDSYLESGSRSIIWNAADRAGKTLSSGIFFARLEDANSSNNRRLIFLK